MTGGSLIAVVDDDQSIRDSTRTLLRSVGYEVATFESGDLFLESEAIPETQCLILDIRMPGIDGLELQRRLNSLDSGIPVIFISARDDEKSRKLAIEAGASHFFHKPFSASHFLAAVQKAMNNDRYSVAAL